MKYAPRPVLQWTQGESKRLRWAIPLEFRGCRLTAYGNDGEGERVILLVSYWAEYLRDINGLCAFCHGDPCADSSPPDSLIARERNCEPPWPSSFNTCPNCRGRPT